MTHHSFQPPLHQVATRSPPASCLRGEPPLHPNDSRGFAFAASATLLTESSAPTGLSRFRDRVAQDRARADVSARTNRSSTFSTKLASRYRHRAEEAPVGHARRSCFTRLRTPAIRSRTTSRVQRSHDGVVGRTPPAAGWCSTSENTTNGLRSSLSNCLFTFGQALPRTGTGDRGRVIGSVHRYPRTPHGREEACEHTKYFLPDRARPTAGPDPHR